MPKVTVNLKHHIGRPRKADKEPIDIIREHAPHLMRAVVKAAYDDPYLALKLLDFIIPKQANRLDVRGVSIVEIRAEAQAQAEALRALMSGLSPEERERLIGCGELPARAVVESTAVQGGMGSSLTRTAPDHML